MLKVTVVNARMSVEFAYGHSSSWNRMMFALPSTWLYSWTSQATGPNRSSTAMDGAPNLPITIEPGLDLATCRKKAAIAELTPNTQAVCRPMLKVKP